MARAEMLSLVDVIELLDFFLCQVNDREVSCEHTETFNTRMVDMKTIQHTLDAGVCDGFCENWNETA
jgi:hypothetical protein